MITIGIIVAMSSEFELLKQLMTSPTDKNINNFSFTEGTLNNKKIILAKSGIGKVCAATTTAELINSFHPKYIINSGLAGGIDKKVNVLDVVIGSEVVYHDVWCGEGNAYGQVQDFPAQYTTSPDLLDKIPHNPSIHKGLICSGDKFISNKEELDSIKNVFPQGIAVDMESAAIAQTCHIYKTPFLSIRIISDNPGIDNHWQQYQNFWQLAPEKNLDIIKNIISQIS